MPDSPPCRICSTATRPIGRLAVLGRHDVGFHQCPLCGFAQTDQPWWLEEAYSDAISATDLGLLARCRAMAHRVPALLACTSVLRLPVLDWGGGYGTLTRMLRDAGIDCRHYDPYCLNVHALGFEGSLEDQHRWGAVLAIEVLEHLVDPWAFLRAAAARTDLVIATTAVVSEPAPPLDSWWYWAPEHGQHISFYSARSLRRIASELGMVYVPTGSMHVFARGHHPALRALMRFSPLRRAALAVRRPSGLLQSDYAHVVRRTMGT